MRVKVIVTVSDGRRRVNSGEVTDVDEATAELWTRLGYVEAVDDDEPDQDPAEGSEDEDSSADESGESEPDQAEGSEVPNTEQPPAEQEEREQPKVDDKSTATRRAPRTAAK